VSIASTPPLRTLLEQALRHVATYRESLGERPVAPLLDVNSLRAALGGELSDPGIAPQQVIEQLVAGAEPGLVTTTGPRFFGFVTGGALDAATCADILATGWDQCAFNAVLSPAAAVVEEVAGGWLKQLLGLPAHASFGLVNGGQSGNTVALAAARHHVLAQAGWDVERDGLHQAPAIRVVASEERHATIDRALRLLGLGTRCVVEVPATAQGAIDIRALARTLDELPAGPAIVCLQAGNVNTGACDDLRAACGLTRARGAWAHVDGAFGLWAAANPPTRHLVDGLELADSWSVDGHKWLNVPYGSGYVFCAHPEAHQRSMQLRAAYLQGSEAAAPMRTPADYVPESSRRATGFATWAALRELGRHGVAALVERCCALARRFATGLAAIDGVVIGNDVVLNQVLVHFGSDTRTDEVIAAVQHDGTCWMGGTHRRGRRYMRIAVSNWSTTEADVDRSVAAIAAIMARTLV
jgi:glutamate/tyrosine decarboxylase-like PLP-dependent enzyme